MTSARRRGFRRDFTSRGEDVETRRRRSQDPFKENPATTPDVSFFTAIIKGD